MKSMSTLLERAGSNMIDIIQVECEEPKVGKVVHTIKPMVFSIENLKTFWMKSREFKTLFTEEVGQDFKKFLELFLTEHSDGTVESRGLFWVVDDFMGVFYMTEIIPEVDAVVHYTFFDKRQKGRVELVRQMLKYGFEKYKFRRLTVEVALYASVATMKFVEEVGFKKEGRLRNKIRYADRWFDLNVYGILREEILSGSAT